MAFYKNQINRAAAYALLAISTVFSQEESSGLVKLFAQSNRLDKFEPSNPHPSPGLGSLKTPNQNYHTVGSLSRTVFKIIHRSRAARRGLHRHTFVN